MKTDLTVVLGLVAGCALGAGLPRSSAQTFAPYPTAPKWEQFCTNVGALGNSPELRAKSVERFNDTIARRGREGFELASTPVVAVGNGGAQSRLYDEMILCFRRPAPNGN